MRNVLPHASAAMAVIIQAQVAAEVSGVVFTSDPVHGCSDRLVIEGSWGLGEAIVQGRVTPDRMILSKSDLGILAREIAVKSLAVLVADGGGVREQTIDTARAEAPCLDDASARAIASFALQAEKAFGTP